MRRSFALIAVLLSGFLILAPSLADARVGGGFSGGSRGGRTYSAPSSTPTAPNGAGPLDRSSTVPGSSYGGAAFGAQGGLGYGGFGRGGLGHGLMGGLLGFGIGSMLFGHGGYGRFGGGLGIFGLLLRLVIIGFVVRWLFRRFSGRSAAASPGLFAPRMAGGPSLFGAASVPIASAQVTIQAADYKAFEVLLKNIQAAWSNTDLPALRTYATPEMVSYFGEQLAENASRGRRNVVSDVHLQKGDLSEAWSEGGRIYATVAMRFSMVDATFDQAGQLVDGSQTEHVSATEFWTFMRVNGGQWMLSAIQQGR